MVDRKIVAGPNALHPQFGNFTKMASPQVVNISLPSLPQGWAGEKDFKIVNALSAATKRNVEPVGPHFLAHARRVCTLNPYSTLSHR